MKYITRKDDLAALPLSKRLYNCLRNRGIHTIGAMIDYPNEHSWTTIRNMGQKSIDEANQWLEVIVTGETGYYLIDDNAEISEQPNPEVNSDSEKSENDSLHTAIVDMPFSVRAKNCLLSAGITSVSQLIGITEEELLGMKNMGRVSAREIRKRNL